MKNSIPEIASFRDSLDRLYEREGFVATHTENFNYLRRFLGFGAATTMEYIL